MPRSRALVAPLLASAALLCACSAITSFDGFAPDDGAGDAATDAASADGAAGDGAIPGTDAGVDVVVGDDAAAGGVPVKLIRCGVAQNAPPYVDSQGRSWGGDVDFDVGTAVTNLDTAAGTSDPMLYRAERYASRTTQPGGFKYTFNGLTSGVHVVKLHFVESTSAPISAPGQRRFDVSIGGQVVLDELDIFAEAGGKVRALVKTFTVTVPGTSLVIAFTPGAAENPKVNAIELLRQP